MVTLHAKKIVVAAIICGVTSVAGFAAAFYYIAGQGSVLRERAQAVADHAIQQQTYQALATLLESTSTERDELGQYILTEDETINFLAETEALATAQGVLITTDALTVVEGAAFNTLKINFSLAGESEAVHSVIQILETLPYMSYVNKLTLGTGTSAEVLSTLELMITLAKI